MSDTTDNRGEKSRSLRDTIRQVRTAEAERSDVVVELRDAERARLEMLAEELPHFDAVADWRICLDTMAETIQNTESLHRRTFVKFLNEVASHFAEAHALGEELNSIAEDWDTFSLHLRDTAKGDSPPNFETLSRQIRRIAFREEHFWGTVLENVKEP